MSSQLLVIEDDDHLRDMLVEFLRDASYEVVAVRLAEQALPVLAKRRPDLVLLDFGMPPGEMTGTELLNRIRETPEWADLPVIIVSGMGDVVNPDVMSAMHVRAVLQKPFDVQTLIDTIATVI